MEDGETRRLIRKNFELAEENNVLLKKMRRSQRWGRAITVVYWAIIIGLPVYAYYMFIRPVVGDLSEVYSGFADEFSNVQKYPEGFAGFLNAFFGGNTLE
jgi:hypothetical protein